MRVEDVVGSGFDDVIIGSSVLNEINAGAGADEVDAGAGPDEIEGTPGDDDFEGGADEDILEFNYSAAPVNVDLEAGNRDGTGLRPRLRCREPPRHDLRRRAHRRRPGET